LFRKLAQARRVAELPKLRAKGAKLARLAIPAGSGKWTENKKSHIHFWMYDTFDPITGFVGIA
jgi:hypothetical protein